ncbi:MAG: hypothetical protein ISS52_03040 [Dehalococcoidia bacterium]|nr:hypothetical protein [Dehalococcoidia bacterium]
MLLVPQQMGIAYTYVAQSRSFGYLQASLGFLERSSRQVRHQEIGVKRKEGIQRWQGTPFVAFGGCGGKPKGCLDFR